MRGIRRESFTSVTGEVLDRVERPEQVPPKVKVRPRPAPAPVIAIIEAIPEPEPAKVEREPTPPPPSSSAWAAAVSLRRQDFGLTWAASPRSLRG